MKSLIVILLFVFTVGCAAQTTNEIPAAGEDLIKSRTQFIEMAESYKAEIAPAGSDEKKLIILVQTVSKETGEEIAGAKIRVYQAGADGEYHPKVKGDEKTAKISGDVTTDSQGRFMITTILPGDYGTAAGNRHIHLYAADAKPTSYDFFFSNFVSAGTRSWVNGSSQAFLLDLYKLDDETLIASVTLELRGLMKSD